jgi:hypothetical protein
MGPKRELCTKKLVDFYGYAWIYEGKNPYFRISTSIIPLIIIPNRG